MSKFEDERMRSLGKRLEEVYAQAEKGLTDKVDSFFADFEEADRRKKRLVDKGELSEQVYTEWRKNKLLMGQKYKDLRDTMAGRLLDANRIAARYINGELPGLYAHNYNEVGTDVARKVKGFSFDLVDERTVRKLSTDNKTLLPYKTVDGRRDVRWNTKKVNAQMLQGILQGESAKKIAKRLQRVTEMNKDSAMRNARTAFTSAQNKGRIDAMEKLADDGVILKKEWIAARDSRTRRAHAELDRTQVDIDKPFENSIGRIMYPGDPNAHPSNVYNCRCTIAQVFIGFKPKGEKEEEEHKPDYSSAEIVEPKRPRRSDFDSEDDYYAAREAYREEKEAYNAEIDDLVKKGSAFKRFNTKDEVVQWANNNGVQIEDGVLEQIDLRAFNEATTALDEMFKQFPEVKSYDLEDFDGSIFRTGFRIGLDDIGLLSANGGLNFNPKSFKNYEQGLRDAMWGQTSGFTVRGDGTFSSYIRHEYGHNVQEYIESQIAMKYHYHVDDWRKNYDSFEAYKQAAAAYRVERDRYDAELLALAGLPGSSEYSNTNKLELFAEGFAEWSSGGKTEFGKAFGEFLKRWYH